MGLAIVLLYVALAFTAPWESDPDLLRLHIMPILVALGVGATIVRISQGRLALAMPQFILMPLFVGFIMFSIVLQGWPGGAIYVFEKFLPLLVLYFVIAVNVTTPGRLRGFSLGLISVAIYLVMRCIAAYYFGISAEAYTVLQSEGGRDFVRVRGLNFLSDPNDFGQFLLACIPLAGLLRRKRSPFWNALFVYVPVAVLLFGIYLSGSRGTLLGLMLLVFMALRRVSKAFAPVITGAMFLALMAVGLGSRSVSLSGGTAAQRIEVWSDLLQAVKHHPFAGIGFDHVFDISVLTAHNSYLLCLVELGLFGYLCWVALLFVHGVQLRELMRRKDIDPDIKRTAGFLIATYGTLLITSFSLSRTYAFTIYVFLAQITGTVIMAKGLVKERPPLRTFSGTWMLASAPVGIGIIIMIYAMVRLHWRV